MPAHVSARHFQAACLDHTAMGDSVFIKIEFFVFVLFSLVLPIALYGYMMWKQAISRKTVLLFGLLLIGIAGISIVLLQSLTEFAKLTPSLLDDRTFSSELSLAIYLLPALFAGIGINMISHLLITHLADAEQRYDRTKANERVGVNGTAMSTTKHI